MELREGGNLVVTINETQTACRVDTKDAPSQFSFDKIFIWETSQARVFHECGLPLVQQCFDGFNSTLFCYGQTGSGKTYTMMGADIIDNDLKGLTPRIVEDIFKTIEEAPAHLEFTVKVSFLEIYMERIRDLLVPTNDNLPIHEDKNRGVFVKGLKEVYVSSIAEVFHVLSVGEQYRSIAATNMNEKSSRSHSIFIVYITQKDTNTGAAKTGKLYLVDLAGSEKVGKTGATGQTLEEAKKINKSLTALGMVINSLTDGKSTHVPYRDSKLTRILQESLGGNAKTTLIVNCSPSSFNDAETVSTLRFGTRAKNIKNSARVNVELSASELKVLLKSTNTEIGKLKEYVKKLESELKVWRSGGTVTPETSILIESRPSTPTVSSPLSELGVVMSPSTADALNKLQNLSVDERDEFLNRENDLMDQLSSKETQFESVSKKLDIMTVELKVAQERETLLANENKDMLKAHAAIKLELEKLTFSHKEQEVAIEGLREQNTDLEVRIEKLSQEDKFEISSAIDSLGEMSMISVDSNETDDQKTDVEEMKRMKAEQMLHSLESAEIAAMEITSPIDDDVDNPQSTGSSPRKDSKADGANSELIHHLMSKHLAEFDTMKKALMRDLQNRCEKVVELEIMLDESSEKYERLQRLTNANAQKRRLNMLEKNQEQLTKVQRQLIEQNSDFKRKLALAERKITNRNERIQDLEAIVQDMSSKMGSEHDKYDQEIKHYQGRIKELESANEQLQSSFQLTARITKPIRGGHGSAHDFEQYLIYILS